MLLLFSTKGPGALLTSYSALIIDLRSIEIRTLVPAPLVDLFSTLSASTHYILNLVITIAYLHMSEYSV